MANELLFRFNPHDAPMAVSRDSVKKMKEALGMTSEKAVIHYALAQLRDRTVSYPRDDGPVDPKAIAKMNRAFSPSPGEGEIVSSVFDIIEDL